MNTGEWDKSKQSTDLQIYKHNTDRSLSTLHSNNRRAYLEASPSTFSYAKEFQCLKRSIYYLLILIHAILAEEPMSQQGHSFVPLSYPKRLCDLPRPKDQSSISTGSEDWNLPAATGREGCREARAALASSPAWCLLAMPMARLQVSIGWKAGRSRGVLCFERGDYWWVSSVR
jgi:hypothetical protein